MQTTSNKKIRNYHIDALKGYAIMLVVLGHSIQYTVRNFDENIVFRYIYSFHMPLFFFLAGFVAWGSKPNLKKKFSSLVIPFLIWHQIDFVLKIIRTHQIPNYATHLISWLKSPDFGLWFLWILFLCFFSLRVIKNLAQEKKWWQEIAIAWLVIGFIKDIPTSLFGIGLLKWELPFFMLGYFISKYRQLIPLKVSIKVLSLLTFPLLAWIWHRTTIPQEIQTIVSHNSIFIINYIPSLYLLVTPLTGISFFYTVIPKTGGWWHQLLQWLGRHSLEIYVIHQSVLFGLGEDWLKISTSFLTGLLGSLCIASIIKQIPSLAKIVFGPSRIYTQKQTA